MSLLGALVGASAIGAGVSSAGGLLGGAFSHGSQSALMGRQFEFNKNLTALGQYYNLQTMRQEDKYQRGLIQDSAMLEKQSLMNAGLNVGSMSDSFGPSQSMANGSAPSSSVGLGSGARFDLGLLEGMRAVSEIKNIESQTAKNNEEANKIAKEASWVDDVNDANVSKTIAETYKARQELRNLRQDLSESISRMKLNDAERNQVNANVDKLMQETEGIKINNLYLADLNNAQINERLANCQKALADSNYTEVRTELAKMGIGVSSNWVESLVALSHFKMVGPAIDDIKQGLCDAIASLANSTPGASAAEVKKGVALTQGVLMSFFGPLITLLYSSKQNE